MNVKMSVEMNNDISKPEQLITEHIDIWTRAILAKSTSGRGSNKKYELYGITKLRELILELAVRGKLVPQDADDEPASVLLEKIAAEKAQLIKDKKIKKTKADSEVNEDEKLFELPSNWQWTRLNLITEINPRNTDVDDKTKVSFVPMTLITTSYDGVHGSESRPWSEIKKGYTHFANGDIAIAKITPCFENSKAAIFRNLENGIGAGTTELHVARPFGEQIERNFLLLYFKSPNFLTMGQRLMTGSAGHKRVPRSFFESNPIPLPPLAEQKRIVAKVDELMLLCDQLDQQTEASIEAHATLVEVLLATLADSVDADELAQNWARISEHFDSLFTTEQSIETLKQTMLQLAVMGKLVPQNPDDEPASVLLESINEVQSKLVKEEGLRTSASKELNADDKYLTQPHGWEWMRLGNLAKFIDYRGKTPTKIESGVRLITAKNIRYGYVDLKPEEFISEDEYTSWMTRGFPKQGDTLFTPEAPLGNAANIDIKGKFALAQRAICFQWHLSGISDFLLLQILAKPFQLQLIDNATGMTATGIKASKLKEIPMIIPPLAEQQRIVAKVEELMAICNQLKEKLKQSQETQVQLTDALIDKALG